MRPHKLIIQAFGPFAKQHTIDFTRLGDNPLFLINGPTGAGKSSILDAICFALYGQTTGKERDPSHMRCDHAAADVLTEVSLDFSLGEDHYRVRRAPTQERPKSRGEGTTIQQTEAQVWQLKPEGDLLLVPQKAQEASQTIEQLTGLNVEQFRQVMVLPQGKFRDFLMADSSQREAIFSKLFQTQIYKRIEDTLKSKAATIRKDVENLQNQIKGILQGADLNTEADAQEQLTTLSPQLDEAIKHRDQTASELAQADKALESAQLLTKAFTALEASQQSLDKLLAQKTSIETKKQGLNRAQAAQKIAHIKTAFEKAKQTNDQLDKTIQLTAQQQKQRFDALEQAKKTFEQAEKDKQPLDKLKQQLADCRQLEPKINQLAEAIKRSQSAQAILDKARSTFDQLQGQQKQLINQISNTEQRLSTLKTSTVSLADKQRQLDNLKRLGQQRANLDKRLEEQKTLQQEKLKREHTLNQRQSTLDSQGLHVKQLELAWHSGQAAILAAELKQGEPCPVCGSQTHPSPANVGDHSNAVTKQNIEAARVIHTDCQQQLSAAQNNVTQIATQLHSVEALIVEQQHELGEHQYKPTQQLRDEWRKLNEVVEALLALQKEQTQLDTELQTLSHQRSQLEQSCEDARLHWQKAQEEQTIAAQQRLHIEQTLPEEYRIAGALTRHIQQLEERINTLTQRYDQALNTLNSSRDRVTQIQAKSEQLQLQKTTAEQTVTDTQQQWTSALSANAFNDDNDFIAAQKSETEQQQLTQDIDQYNHQLSGCKATIEQQTQQLAQQQRPNLEALEAEKNQRKVTADHALNSWKTIDNRHQQLTDVLKKLDQAHQSNHALESEYKVYGTLSDVANGQTGDKISLQRFVLSVLLDDVLIEASHRLNHMSKGRYLLLRKEDRAKGNKASGLELEVEDAYTGKTRSVATLSGGESFMAALSLALGLSDVVQAYAGGIKLETLFIDEGFGSLDQESLDLAIKTLIDLQSSGRMIGIISHVSELREQMALRVDVHSSASGSHITLNGK